MSVRPAKSQISLGIPPVWSESSLCVQWVAKDPNFLHADSEDSDQTGRMPRQSWVFAGRTVTLLVFSCRGSIIFEMIQKRNSCGDSETDQSNKQWEITNPVYLHKVIYHCICLYSNKSQFIHRYPNVCNELSVLTSVSSIRSWPELIKQLQVKNESQEVVSRTMSHISNTVPDTSHPNHSQAGHPRHTTNIFNVISL